MLSLNNKHAEFLMLTMRIFFFRWATVFIGCLVFGLMVGAEQQSQSPNVATNETASQDVEKSSDETVFRTGINFIRVDVIATDDDGNHIRDLDLADFEVYEDDELQDIETFELIEINQIQDVDAEPPRPIINRFDEEREAARTDTRVFVIFFDDYHVRWENGARAGQELSEFLRTNLFPTDLVGLMHPLTPLDSVRLTRNHEPVFKAVENLYGRKYDYKPVNMFEQRYSQYPSEIVERIRNDVSLSALEGLMIRMGTLREGRKNVLLISEGFSNYVPPVLRNMNAEMFGGLSEPVESNPRYEQTAQFFSDQNIFFDLRDVFSTANRFNTTIYSLDPRGLAVSEFDMSQPIVDRATDDRVMRATRDTLYVLASETDGRTILNTNDFEPGLKQMLNDSSAYYLLGYNSTRSANDGKFHELEVRVKRTGVDLRHRQGFWALTERDVERAMTATENEPPKAVDVAIGALAEPRRGRRLIRTWFGMEKGAGGRTKVTFLWEPVSDGRNYGEQPAQVLLTAINETGEALYRGRVPGQTISEQLSDGRESLGVISNKVEFLSKPGSVQVGVVIEDDVEEVLDRERIEINVPDITGSELVLTTPTFIRARNHMEWVDLVSDWDAMPTLTHEFRRTDRLLVRFNAYASGVKVDDVSARLLNRTGEVMYPLEVQIAEAEFPNQVDLWTAHLAPGEYVIELTASSLMKSLTKLIAFRLGS